jgi:hypothetical protein
LLNITMAMMSNLPLKEAGSPTTPLSLDTALSALFALWGRTLKPMLAEENPPIPHILDDLDAAVVQRVAHLFSAPHDN